MDSEFFERVSKMSPQRLALLAARLKEQVDAQHEPLAIVGMGCRLPGGVSDPDAPGRMSVRCGGFLDDVKGFDASFFGIAAREAQTLDPQQRLLLEVTWEALEQAGIAPAELAGASAGVFVGICNSDHFQRMLSRGADRIDAYVASGNAHSTAAGRISYFLGLRGPAIAIDTACSSSLVAFHLACQSLRRGETELAIVGGVNLMCSPETTIALSKAHMLAPDGRCKTFDASADGFSRGEGCVVLVLKRLSAALGAGDRIFAVVRGTAVNQDGKSGGLTVPNGPAQEAVVRAALADGGVDAKDVDYVEAHGTGTSLGDPIEVRALGGVFGPERPSETPLVIGSVKTNFGHLESAAGIAGILKVVLSLVHERIPKHLHFTEPSPHIDWASHPVDVASAARPWQRGARRRLAGVSSFGFSGTNAHVILEEAPLPEPQASALERKVQCLALSAQDPAALRALAAAADRALANGVPLADAAHTAGAGRSHFSERLSVVASGSAEARAALAAFAAGAPHPNLARGTAPKGGPLEVVFLFTGQGSQYPGMAQALYETAPVFRDVIDRCSEILGADAQGRTLKSVLAPGPAEGAPLHDTAWTQPALFALEYGLSELWRSFGVEPAAVIGHSVGEYVAACVAGVYSLEQGLSLIQERGRLLSALPAGGTMAALFAPIDDVARAVAPVADRVAIAAVNGPESVVISGAAEAVEAIVRDFEARNVQGHRLFVSFAAHSPLVAPAMAAMQAAAAKVTMSAPKLPIAWNVTGGVALPGGAPDPAYFARHLREPVRFAEGLASLASYGAFLEVGPHPVLVALAERCFSENDAKLLLGSLRRGKDDWRELMTSLGKLYARGAKLDFAGVDRAYARNRVAWPTYPFQRQSFWVEPVDPRAVPRPAPRAGSLSGERMPTAVPLFETTLSPQSPAYLGQHRLLGSALVAGPVFLEMAQSAAREELGGAPRAVADFTIREPLVLPEPGKTLQTHLSSGADGSIAFAILSAPSSARGEWLRHAEGRLVAPSRSPSAAPALAELESRLGPSSSCEPFYARLGELGIELGEAFRPLASARIREREALAALRLPANCKNTATWAHPALLDGCLQAVGLTVPAPADAGDVYLFSGVERIELARPLPDEFFAYARSRAVGDKAAEFRGDVTLLAPDGSVLGELAGVSLRRASREVLTRVAGAGDSAGLYYRVDWRPAPLVPAASPSLVPPERFASRLQRRFDSLAEQHQLAAYDEIMPALDRQSAYYVASALQKLGFSAEIGRNFAVAEEAARLGVLPRYSRLFARLLEMLAEDGVLRRSGAGYEVVRGLDSVPPPELTPAQFGTNDAELSMLRRAGPELPRVLRGEQDPLQLLFPGGAFAEARKLYVESPYARTYNHAIGEALESAIAALPEGARLRVLEIGAGTGGTTTYTLPLLPPERTRYTFTDLSPLFLQRAGETFSNFDFVDYRLLDIENDPLAQGFEAGGYDLVIAANVLHATSDLGRAVDHAKKLLAPSGILLLLEGVSAERWVDLTFGLTDGWWRFTDTELRASYPLISRAAWSGLLEARGFTGVSMAPEGPWVARRGAQQAVVVARAPARTQRWTVIGGPEAFAAAVCRKLRDRGDTATHLPAQPVAPLPEADTVLYLGALELTPKTAELPRRSEDLACAFPISWLTEVTRSERSGRVWLVTRGAQLVAGRSSVSPEWQAPLWGVGRGFALEQPSRFGGLVDLPPEGSDEELTARLLELADPYRRVEDHEEQVAFRDGARYSARLVEAPAPPAKSPRFAADATYLVSGGFGGLGLLVGRYLAERGARHVALLGRRPDPNAEGVRAIEALGARVIPIAADLGEPSALDAIQRALAEASAPELRGIFHAAADLSAAPIGALDDATVRRMLRPKLHGTLLLERLSRGKQLDFFVLFSSTTALLGASGLAHYAAANAFLDAFAVSHAQERVLSVNFGTWEAMRLATESEQATFRSGGLLPMSSASALEALGRLLSGPEPQAVVARIDWSVLRPLYEARKPRRFLAELGLAKSEAVRAESTEVATETLATRVAGLPAEARREMITDFVVHEVSTVLGADRNLPLDKGLFELGMDSLMSVELKKRLERGAGRPLPSTLTFNYPNVNALAAFLDTELGGASVAAAKAKPAPAAPPPTGDLDKLSTDDLAARLRARLERAR